jgi:hypothetical protein
MSADGPQPARDGENTNCCSRVTAVAGLNFVSVVGFCLIVASCSYHHGDEARVGKSAPAPDGDLQGDADDQRGIDNAWKEEDRKVREHLYSSGWIDRAAGVAHIPIDRAMDLILLEKDPSGPQSDGSEDTSVRAKDTALRSSGHELFRKYGCDVCHSPNAYTHAPSLVGIYGEKVRLSDGTFVRADDQYLRNSILHAGVQVVAGYTPIMPSYSSYIPEPDVLELIAYLKSFKRTKDDPAASP